VRVCHHPKGTTIKKTGKAFQGLQNDWIIRVDRNYARSSTRKALEKVTKGPQRETGIVFLLLMAEILHYVG